MHVTELYHSPNSITFVTFRMIKQSEERLTDYCLWEEGRGSGISDEGRMESAPVCRSECTQLLVNDLSIRDCILYYKSQSQWTGEWACFARTDTWTLETLTRMSKQPLAKARGGIANTGHDRGSAAGTERSWAFMCWWCLRSRHVRLLFHSTQRKFRGFMHCRCLTDCI